MKIGDQGDPALQSPTPSDRPALIRIIMSEEAIASRVGIVAESQMPSDDTGKGLDVVLDERKLNPR